MYKRNTTNIILSIIYMCGIVIMPIIVSGFRSNVGTDFEAYHWHFYHWADESIFKVFTTNTEPLSFVLHPIANILFKSEWGYFLLSSLIIILIVVFSLSNYINKLSMTLALYIYYMLFWSFSLNGIRQMLALAVVFYSFKYIANKKIGKYLITILIATAFHNTAIFCLSFYFLNIILNSLKSTKKITLAVIVLLSPFYVPYLLKLGFIIPYFSKYEKYLISFNDGGFGFLIWILPPLIPVIFYWKSFCKYYKEYEFLLYLSVLQIPLQYLGYFVSFGSRIALYCNLSQILLVPILLKSIKSQRDRWLVSSYYIIWYFVYYIFQSYLNNFSGTFPFQWI